MNNLYLDVNKLQVLCVGAMLYFHLQRVGHCADGRRCKLSASACIEVLFVDFVRALISLSDHLEAKLPFFEMVSISIEVWNAI